ncbi:hypothetical protein AB6A40_003624 [Gnathostoma spinigerum]|uniref:Uncharacterized protein n=1 Tax=Gnathostoma spinigerum TaxID=75299 RepID=A0ABD6EB96_9BILA
MEDLGSIQSSSLVEMGSWSVYLRFLAETELRGCLSAHNTKEPQDSDDICFNSSSFVVMHVILICADR